MSNKKIEIDEQTLDRLVWAYKQGYSDAILAAMSEGKKVSKETLASVLKQALVVKEKEYE